MNVISGGALKGYVVVHPKWAGFTTDDYYFASDSVYEGINKIPAGPTEYRVGKGNIDLSGYELVRREFISTTGQIMMTITMSRIQFSKAAVVKMAHSGKIELLVNPLKRTIAVKKASGNTRNVFVWCKEADGEYYPKPISGSAFIPTLYRLFGWKPDTKYKIIGAAYQSAGEMILLFDTAEAILMMDPNEEEGDITPDDADPGLRQKKGKLIKAYPREWVESFGENYYVSKAREESEMETVREGFDGEQIPYMSDSESVTTPEEAADHIRQILKRIGADDE